MVYEIFIVASSVTDLRDKITAIEGWLLSAPNEYHELTDTYNPGMLRRAAFYGPNDWGVTLRRAGTATITFTCYPFRFDAETYTEADVVVDGDVLENPYAFDAAPIITVYGSEGAETGTFTITSANSTKTWTVNFGTGVDEVVIDSENMTIAAGTANYSDHVIGDGFPKLAAGDNAITLTGDIAALGVIARWRTL